MTYLLLGIWKTSCTHYWIPAHGPPKSTDPADRPPKHATVSSNPYPCGPDVSKFASPVAPVVVALALRNSPSGAPHNNTIYVAAVRSTGCCSQDI